MNCNCGQPKESWQDDYQIVHYDKDGNIVWATCPHGMVIKNNEVSSGDNVSPDGERG